MLTDMNGDKLQVIAKLVEVLEPAIFLADSGSR